VRLKRIGEEAQSIPADEFLQVGRHEAFELAFVKPAPPNAAGRISQHFTGVAQAIGNSACREPSAHSCRIAIGRQACGDRGRGDAVRILVLALGEGGTCHEQRRRQGNGRGQRLSPTQLLQMRLNCNDCPHCSRTSRATYHLVAQLLRVCRNRNCTPLLVSQSCCNSVASAVIGRLRRRLMKIAEKYNKIEC
jgi:hypothetical protein